MARKQCPDLRVGTGPGVSMRGDARTVVGVPSWLRRALRGAGAVEAPSPVLPAGEPGSPAERAADAWGVLVRRALEQRAGHLRVRDAPDGRASVAALWPFSQVLAAGLAVARMAGEGVAVQSTAERGADPSEPARLVDGLYGALATYRSGDGYATHPGGSHLFYDDNAWIGLAAVQGHRQCAGVAAPGGWLPVARRATACVLSGQDLDGAVRWEARGDVPSPRNACSTAPAVALALALDDLAPDDALVGAATSADGWLRRTLVAPDGLVWDHEEPDGRIDRTVWSYNQGSAVAADLAWWRRTRDDARRRRAVATARASLEHFGSEDRLWRQPPAFNAVLFRNLLALHDAVGLPAVVDALDDYLARLWSRARDPRTGRFTEGGVGRYDDGGTLDHAGVVQLLALRATPAAWSELT